MISTTLTTNSTHVPLKGGRFKLVGSFQPKTTLPTGQFLVYSNALVAQGKAGSSELDCLLGNLTFEEGKLVTGQLDYFSFEDGIIIKENLSNQALIINEEQLTMDSYGRLHHYRKLDGLLFQESHQAGFSVSVANLDQSLELALTDQGYLK